MRVKMILPALTEAKSPFFRPVKYSLFPPLGLAQLAGYFDEDDEIVLQDEHVETLDLDDEPDLVVIQAYITSAYRSYEIADAYRRRGAYVCLGGLHVTSLPDEAARHADTIFLGPGEDTWPRFLADYRAGRPAARYQSTVRTLVGAPRFRRDLVKRRLYFLDDHLFGHPKFASALFEGTVEWAISQGIETATFHILTPYPGTGLHARMEAEGRITTENWDQYDTRHVVYRPARLTPEELEAGYWRAYRDFYRWGSIAKGASAHDRWPDRLRHVAYAGGWKKLEPMWDLLIRAKRATSMVPVLESVLSAFGEYRPGRPTDPRANQGIDDLTIARRTDGDERGSERAMKRREPTPLRTSGRTSGSEKPVKIEPPVEVSEVHSSPGALRPRFIPLALSIDLGEVGPVGSLTTTTVQLDPPAPEEPTQPAAVQRLPSARRHLRLLPSS